MNNFADDHYRAVLADLREQRKRKQDELADIESALTAIERIVGKPGPASLNVTGHAPIVGTLPKPGSPTARTESITDYSRVSVRWAVLGFLAEVATGPMGTGAIATALAERGIEKQGPSRFGNIVSAVISNLKAKGELEAVYDGLYQLTPAGRAMWAHIRESAKFRLAQGTLAPHDLLVGTT